VTLAEVVLAAVLSLGRAPAVDVVAERPRLEALAADVALAVRDASAQNPFTGPARDEAAALVLVAVAFHESGFDARVQDCRLTGDRRRGQAPHEGPSVTLWQLKGAWARGGLTREEVCRSPRLAAAQALRVFAGHARRCARSPWLAAFQGYASGSCGRESLVAYRTQEGDVAVKQQRAGLVRCATWERLAKRAGLVGATCSGGRVYVTKKEGSP
jgi:hypothetical protein